MWGTRHGARESWGGTAEGLQRGQDLSLPTSQDRLWHRVGLWHSIQLALSQGCLVLFCLQAGGFQLLLVHIQSTNLPLRPPPACLLRA